MAFGLGEIVIFVVVLTIVAITAFFVGRIPVNRLEKSNRVLLNTVSKAQDEVRSANAKKVSHIVLLAQARKDAKLATENAEVLHKLSGCTKEDTWADHTADSPEGATEETLAQRKAEKALRASGINGWAKVRTTPKETARFERPSARPNEDRASQGNSTDASHYVAPVVAPVIVDTPVVADCVSVSCD